MESQQITVPNGQPEHLPSITVIVPALNEERFITETLSQLVAQHHPQDRLEILVVDGGSTDQTLKRVRAFMAAHPDRVQIFHNPNRLSSSARNIGIRHANGDYVLFVDAHVYLPNRDVIYKMGLAALQTGARVLARPQPLNPPGLSSVQAAIAGVRASALGHSGESYIYSQFEGWVSPLSVGVMYQRSLFKTYGLFDEGFDAAEDLEFNYRLERAGIQAYLSPQFTVRYYPRESFGALFKQMRRYGTGRINFSRKHPERFRMETFFPCVSSMGVLLTLTAATAFDTLRPWVLGAAILLSVLVMVLTARHMRRSHFGSLLLAPLCLCVIHFGLGYGVLVGLLSMAPQFVEESLELGEEG